MTKKSLKSAMSVFCLLVGAVSFCGDDNVIVNGDFEEGNYDWLMHWKSPKGYVNAVVGEEISRPGGRRCLMFRFDTPRAGTWMQYPYVYWPFDDRLKLPGNGVTAVKYKLVYHYKFEGKAPGKLTLRARLYKKDNKDRLDINAETSPVTDGKWHEVKKEMTVPAGYSLVCFDIEYKPSGKGTGVLCLDDLYFGK